MPQPIARSAAESFDAGARPSTSLDRIARVRQQILAQCEALSPILYAWAHLRLRAFSNSGVAPEDIVQETWLRALATVSADEERLAAPAALKAWLIGIAQNVLFEELRRGRQRPRNAGGPSSNAPSDWLAGQVDTVTSICTSLARHEAVGRVLEFAAGLEDLDRQLLIRCAFEDLTASDVARRLGIEPDTAIKRWQRLREHLRATRMDQRLGLSAG